MTNVRASELASKIQLNTSVLIEHLTTQGLPLPSFSVETPVVQSLPPEIAQAREAMVEAAEELQALVLGPLANLMRLTGPNVGFLSLSTALSSRSIVNPLYQHPGNISI